MFLFGGFPLCFSENNHDHDKAILNRHVCAVYACLTNSLLKRAPGRDQICGKRTQTSISETQSTTL